MGQGRARAAVLFAKHADMIAGGANDPLSSADQGFAPRGRVDRPHEERRPQHPRRQRLDPVSRLLARHRLTARLQIAFRQKERPVGSRQILRPFRALAAALQPPQRSAIPQRARIGFTVTAPNSRQKKGDITEMILGACRKSFGTLANRSQLAAAISS